ncbi:ABC-2 type transporter [uncultured archaeon]|nr:ABC-2 type transporter [uncultured archaeon]
METLKSNIDDIKMLSNELEQYKEIFAQNPSALSAYTKLASTGSQLSQSDSALNAIDMHMQNAIEEMSKAKRDLSQIAVDLEGVKQDLGKSNEDMGYFNSQLSALGETIDRVNSLIENSLATTDRVKSDLDASRELMDGFIAKLDELQALSPDFLSNPVIINKVNVYGATNLEIMTPVAIALVLLLTTILLTGVSFIVERNEGAYSRLIISTTSKMTLFAGKILGQLIFVVAEAAIILAFAVFGFGVKVSAPLPDLFIAICIIATSFITLGLFISNYTRIQSTTILAGLLIVIPMIFISGIIIPAELMSPEIQRTGAELPLSLGAMILTELIVKGTPLAAMWLEFAKLLASSAFFTAFTLMNRNL